jgi:hypothetical protein
MTNFEDTLQAASRAILRRELTDAERVEFLELAGAIGMSSVEDYLYMLMVFKRNEDRVSSQMLSFKKEMKARFDAMGILENKIDARLGKTLEEMLDKMAGVFVEKADELASQKNKVETWRTWAFMMSALVMFSAMILNAGYLMGSGAYPFWLYTRSKSLSILSWFFNVPSGWILLLGSGPFLYNVHAESTRKIWNNKRFGMNSKENIILYAKSVASLIALGIAGLLVLYTTGMRRVF